MFFVVFLQSGVRTTQWTMQSVLTLRAFLERKNQDHLHTLSVRVSFCPKLPLLLRPQ
jgi:hypothetical protein